MPAADADLAAYLESYVGRDPAQGRRWNPVPLRRALDDLLFDGVSSAACDEPDSRRSSRSWIRLRSHGRRPHDTSRSESAGSRPLDFRRGSILTALERLVTQGVRSKAQRFAARGTASF